LYDRLTWHSEVFRYFHSTLCTVMQFYNCSCSFQMLKGKSFLQFRYNVSRWLKELMTLSIGDLLTNSILEWRYFFSFLKYYNSRTCAAYKTIYVFMLDLMTWKVVKEDNLNYLQFDAPDAQVSLVMLRPTNMEIPNNVSL
jgi:hypothetical protein